MQVERKGSALEWTLKKREHNDLLNCGGLNRFMASCSHANCIFKTSTLNIKTTAYNGHKELKRPYINQRFHVKMI